MFIDDEQIAQMEKSYPRERLPRGPSHGRHVQHDARERPDLVVRGQQLPARARAAAVRPALLERRRDAPAGRDAACSTCARSTRRTACCSPAASSSNGVPIDLSKVKTPVYLFATKDDHIAPWQSCYPGTQAFAGPKRFVLGASGHIAGVINPPAANKYGYWTNQRLPADPQKWLDGRHLARRLLVARLDRLARPQGRQEGAGPPPRRRQARAPRGRPRRLRQGPGERMSGHGLTAPPAACKSRGKRIGSARPELANQSSCGTATSMSWNNCPQRGHNAARIDARSPAGPRQDAAAES